MSSHAAGFTTAIGEVVSHLPDLTSVPLGDVPALDVPALSYAVQAVLTEADADIKSNISYIPGVAPATVTEAG